MASPQVNMRLSTETILLLDQLRQHRTRGALVEELIRERARARGLVVKTSTTSARSQRGRRSARRTTTRRVSDEWSVDDLLT